jgi:sulfopyruvate decarboxylase TPP-binding subunit
MKKKFEEMLRSLLQQSGIDYLVCVPTSGINSVYRHFENEKKCIYVTREEEGVALAAGLRTANKNPLLLIQQSGMGNLLNAVFTLADPYGIEFPIVVLIRGEEDENPIHHYSSAKTLELLKLLNGKKMDLLEMSVEQCMELIKEKHRWIYCHY